MSLLIVLYLFLILIVPLALSAGVSYRTLPEGQTCPVCGGETLRLVARWLGIVSKALPDTSLHRRWCPGCGWDGICRVPEERPPETPAAPGPPGTAAGTHRSEGASTMPNATSTPEADASDTIELRKLELNGQPWRVLLRFWSDADQWCGRLLFLASSGRLWADPREPFRGSSPLDVLGQALALSDRILTYRLREVISD